MTPRAFTVVTIIALAIVFSITEHVRAAGTQARKRVVWLEITVPSQGAPPLRIATPEGEMATVEVADVGKFGFEPIFPNKQGSAVAVSIFDIAATPRRRLGDVLTGLGAKAVQSKTTPSFGIRLLRVTEPK